MLEAAERSLQGERRGLRAAWPFLGPAFIAAVAYVDPGNFATNFAGGAKFGYLLLWVILAANLMAMLIQTLSAKLGIATGHEPAGGLPRALPAAGAVGLWVQAELIAMATDLAEFIGAALGLNLIFGMPLFAGRRRSRASSRSASWRCRRGGFRQLEAVIVGLVGMILAGFAFEVVPPAPTAAAIAQRALDPRLRRLRERAARRRHPRRDRHAARHLPALGADPAARRRRDDASAGGASCASSGVDVDHRDGHRRRRST